MSEAEKDYELKILKIVINKHLDKSISISEESFSTIEANLDEVVWDLAKRVYSESGHKVELSTVRDVVNLRIETIKNKLDEKKYFVEQAEKKVYCPTIYSESEIFGKVKKLISGTLNVDLDRVIPSSHLENDLGVDDDNNEFMEIVMTLEEEFDIEITDSEMEDELDIHYSSAYSGNTSSSSGSFWSMLGTISAISSSSYSSYTSTGNNCIVQSFVDLVYKKLHD